MVHSEINDKSTAIGMYRYLENVIPEHRASMVFNARELKIN